MKENGMIGPLSLVVIVQTLAELFPISSSGHVHLFIRCMTRLGYPFSEYQLDSCEGLSHLPMILVLLIFYRNQLYTFLGTACRYIWDKKMCSAYDISLMSHGVVMVFYGIVTTGITLLFYYSGIVPFVITCFGERRVLTCGFLITTLFLLSLLCQPKKREYESWTLSKVILLGIVQGCSLLPGVSRFGVTFVVARHSGVSSRDAFSISWIMAVPLMLGAVIRDVVWNVSDHSFVSLGAVESCMLVCLVTISFVIFEKVYTLALRDRMVGVSISMVLPLILSLVL